MAVHSHVGGASVNDIVGFQNLHFYLENDAEHTVTPMLRLGVTEQDLTGMGIGVGVNGAAKLMDVGDSIRLLQTKSGGTGLITDAEIQNQITGDHGASVSYKFDIKKAADDPTALIATVTERAMKSQSKSFVETRAALTDLVNYGGDALAGESRAAAKSAAANLSNEADRYRIWARMGGSALRVESGSHVDTRA